MDSNLKDKLWWEKLLDGAAGYLARGPLGRLLNVAIGNQQEGEGESARGRFSAGDKQRVQAAFFTCTFSVMGHLARTDGTITKLEIALAKKVMEQMKLSAEQKQAAVRLFNEGKRPEFPFEEVLEQFKQECDGHKNLLRLFIEIQIHAASADGAINDDERRMLAKMAGSLGFTRNEYDELFAMVLSNKGKVPASSMPVNMPVTVEDACKILGVRPNDSAADIKKAYRRLLSQHHPDKLVAKGLPEEMMRVASDKIQEIKAAFELIQAESIED